MAMHAEAHSGCDTVVVQHAQRAKIHSVFVVIPRETESVAALQPTMIGKAPAGRAVNHLLHAPNVTKQSASAK